MTENQTPIRAVLTPSRFLTRWPCHVCGGCTEKVAVLCEVHSDHPTHAGLLVCEGCLKSGDFDARLTQHALDLEEQALQMQQHAVEIRALRGRLVAPTFAEWQHMEALMNATYGSDHTFDEISEWSMKRQLAVIEQYLADLAIGEAGVPVALEDVLAEIEQRRAAADEASDADGSQEGSSSFMVLAELGRRHPHAISPYVAWRRHQPF